MSSLWFWVKALSVAGLLLVLAVAVSLQVLPYLPVVMAGALGFASYVGCARPGAVTAKGLPQWLAITAGIIVGASVAYASWGPVYWLIEWSGLRSWVGGGGGGAWDPRAP